MSRGIRNNNPGNIDFHQRTFDRDPWVGELGLEHRKNGRRNRFTTFSSPVYGIRAMAKILLTYYRYRKASDGSKIDTAAEIIDRWAPPTENVSSSYAAFVRKVMDLDPGELIDVEDPAQLTGLVEALIVYENGHNPYSQVTIAEAVALALG